MELLLGNGLTINGHFIEIKFGLCICDTPARVMVKGVCNLMIQSNRKKLISFSFEILCIPNQALLTSMADTAAKNV